MARTYETQQNLMKKQLYIRKILWIPPIFKGTNECAVNVDEVNWTFGRLKCELCKEEISDFEVNVLVLNGKILATICNRCRERYKNVFE